MEMNSVLVVRGFITTICSLPTVNSFGQPVAATNFQEFSLEEE
jgi:hypothetical protein